MVVSWARVLGACCVALGATAGCASSAPPPPHSADLIMPEWITQPPTQSKSKTATRLVQKPGVLYGDSTQAAGPTDQEEKSPFMGSSTNSRFYGGSGCIDKPGHKCP
jgi:hypothetical protein